MFVVIYLLSGVVAPWLISMVAPTTEPVMGAGVAVTGILGSYFLLLPRSLVLVLVPLPSWLSEVPALFFLGAWWLLHLVSLVLTDTAPHSSYAAVGTLVVAFVMGAGLGRVARRSVIW
jgi:membrane associated rhomboid family serine protease